MANTQIFRKVQVSLDGKTKKEQFLPAGLVERIEQADEKDKAREMARLNITAIEKGDYIQALNEAGDAREFVKAGIEKKADKQ
jgi:hypothetical protein